MLAKIWNEEKTKILKNKIIWKLDHYWIKIKTLYSWSRFGLTDGQWDHSFILKTIQHKLKLMEKNFRSRNCLSMECEKDADNMNFVITLIDKYLNFDYFEESLKEFNETFPGYDWDFEWKEREDGYSELINKDTPEQSEMIHKAIKESYKNQREDLNTIFDFTRDHIEEWWD